MGAIKVLLVCVLGLTQGAPQVDPNSEVEVVGPPISTNVEGEGGFGPPGGVRVLFVPRDFGVLLSTLLGGLGEQRPTFARPSVFDSEEAAAEDEEGVPRRGCGLTCLFSFLESQIQSVQSQIDEVKDRQNEVDFVAGSEDDFDVNNSTFTTKVLDDGTLVHINKTTISDTNEDGSSFFFHKSIITNLGGPSEESDEEASEEEEEFELENEIFDDKTISENDPGVDDGLTN